MSHVTRGLFDPRRISVVWPEPNDDPNIPYAWGLNGYRQNDGRDASTPAPTAAPTAAPAPAATPVPAAEPVEQSDSTLPLLFSLAALGAGVTLAIMHSRKGV